MGADHSPDVENYWEDDDDSFSSEQEGSDDAAPSQVIDSSEVTGQTHTIGLHEKHLSKESMLSCSRLSFVRTCTTTMRMFRGRRRRLTGLR